MKNTIVYVLGHYGVGKLTVAKALCATTGARLFDNHLINNVVFSLVEADGKTKLAQGVWDATGRIRDVAFEVMEMLSPPDFSFVLTNSLIDQATDRIWYERTVDLAERRGARFVPVILSCDEAENMRRIASPDRRRNMKHVDASSALARRREVTLLPITHPNRLELDTTSATPAQSVAAILAHIETLP